MRPVIGFLRPEQLGGSDAQQSPNFHDPSVGELFGAGKIPILPRMQPLSIIKFLTIAGGTLP